MPVTPSHFTFKLDQVELQNFEVPAEFEIGHELQLAVHKYISESGQPVIKVHNMGAFPIPTNWTGILYGQNALPRHQTLDRLCCAQQPITWQYGPLQYTVVIQKYVAKVFYQSEVHYTIDLVVITDNNGATPLPSLTITVDTTAQSALSTANTAVLTTPAVPQNIINESNQLNAAIQAAYPLGNAAYLEILAIVELVKAVIASTQIFVGPLEATATSETDLTTLSNMFNAMQAWGVVLANLVLLLGQSPSPTTFTAQAGSNLFDVASQFYPNADLPTAVAALAAANNMTDNFIYAPTQLVIPPLFE